jgi:hypothetical protein
MKRKGSLKFLLQWRSWLVLVGRVSFSRKFGICMQVHMASHPQEHVRQSKWNTTHSTVVNCYSVCVIFQMKNDNHIRTWLLSQLSLKKCAAFSRRKPYNCVTFLKIEVIVQGKADIRSERMLFWVIIISVGKILPIKKHYPTNIDMCFKCDTKDYRV